MANQPERDQMRRGIELCFRPDAEADVWSRTLEKLFAWRPSLAPRELKRISDIDAPLHREPWNDTRHHELARRLAEEATVAWAIYCAQGVVLVHRERTFVKLAPTLRQVSDHAADGLRDLLSALEGVLLPSLAMALDPDSEAERDLVLERLAGVPPVLYIGRDVIDPLGGSAKLLSAPVSAREVSGGILFEVLPTQVEAMRSFLGISPDAPLSVFE